MEALMNKPALSQEYAIFQDICNSIFCEGLLPKSESNGLRYILKLLDKYVTKGLLFSASKPDAAVSAFWGRTHQMLTEQKNAGSIDEKIAFAIVTNLLLLLNTSRRECDKNSSVSFGEADYSAEQAIAFIDKAHGINEKKEKSDRNRNNIGKVIEKFSFDLLTLNQKNVTKADQILSEYRCLVILFRKVSTALIEMGA